MACRTGVWRAAPAWATRVASISCAATSPARAPTSYELADITEHPTREGKIYRCVVIDVFSRYVAAWSVDSTRTTRLVNNALGMATRRGDPAVAT